jgi:diguanylate cyclase (GGDEF)-like protein/PAS domain S-box-containing protein
MHDTTASDFPSSSAFTVQRPALPRAGAERAVAAMPWLVRLAIVGVLAVMAAAAAWQLRAADDGERQRIQDAEALTLIGRQSTQARLLAVQALRAVAEPDHAPDLSTTLRAMTDEALRLTELVEAWRGTSRTELRWEDVREHLWARAGGLQMALDAGDAPRARALAAQVVSASDRFVELAEAKAGELRGAVERRHAAAERDRLGALLLFLLLAAAMGVVVGEPLARLLQRQQRRLAAQTLELQRLALVADRTRNAVVISDAQGRIDWVNAGFTRVTGYRLDEVRGHAPGAVLRCERTDPQAAQAIDRAIAAGEAARVEILNRAKGGRIYWADVDLQPLHDALGRLTGFVGVETDISAQVQRGEHLDAVLRAIPSGVVVQDAQGRVVEANPAAEQILGLTRDQLLGRDSLDPRWASLREDGEPFPGHEHPAMVTLATGVPQRAVVMGVRHPDGETHWLRVNTRLLVGADGATRGVVSSFADETEVRAKDHMLALTVQAAGLGTFSWNAQTGELPHDARWAGMLGYAPGELEPTARMWQSMVHPDDVDTMRAALRRHLADPAEPCRVEYRIRRKDGQYAWVLATGSALEWSPDGRVRRMAGVQMDITPRKLLEQQLSHAANTDALTQLPNRASIVERVRAALARLRGNPAARFAVLFMDFDRFKVVNDSLGHDAGDELLRQIGARLHATLRSGDALGRGDARRQTAARIGGDEFVVLLEGLREPGDAQVVAQRLLATLAVPYDIAGREVRSSVSIGIVTSDGAAQTVEEVMRDADIAMYEAKRSGRGRYVLFGPEMHARLLHDLDLEVDLRRALRSDELFVVYQPIVDLATRRAVGAEALVRWQHPTRGVVPPTEFIPLAEETGMIADVGEFVLRRACAEMAAWQRTLGAAAPASVSVNLSRAQLRPQRTAAMVAAALADAGIAPSALRLEVTESLAMQDDAAIGVLHELRALGVGLALDDFGTGHSSLASLDQLPIDMVKVDRAFVARLAAESYQFAVVRATLTVAQSLHLAVVAEGVEREDQARALLEMGCRLAQGYLFSRPLPDLALREWVQATARSADEAFAI